VQEFCSLLKNQPEIRIEGERTGHEELSAGVERLFSRDEGTHGDKRKRMKEETPQSLMYVNKNG
jgi:hypothetical protein